jgi:peptidylprolyl isomerase
MKTVTNGASVELHYKGTFPDGEVFDSSWDRGETMNILVGQGKLIKGFESALLGMTEGQKKTVNLTADEAYGPIIEQAIITVPKSAFPEDFSFEEGITVQGSNKNGMPVMAKVINFNDETVTLDHNHPLAGKDINFEIELVKIDSEE